MHETSHFRELDSSGHSTCKPFQSAKTHPASISKCLEVIFKVLETNFKVPKAISKLLKSISKVLKSIFNVLKVEVTKIPSVPFVSQVITAEPKGTDSTLRLQKSFGKSIQEEGVGGF